MSKTGIGKAYFIGGKYYRRGAKGRIVLITDGDSRHTKPPRRPLSSLTEGEINTCYKQAMGVDYDVERIERSDTHSSITAYVGKDYLSLDEIDGHVRASATIFFDGWEYPAMMRMTPLVRYLDSIGIEIGHRGAAD